MNGGDGGDEMMILHRNFLSEIKIFDFSKI